jgi:CheY-like chemotaxis protein
MSGNAAQQRPRVLLVEDGHEYIEAFTRYLGDEFEFVRAGDGLAALRQLTEASWHAVFLDMRFDRADCLLGDLDALELRFHGDRPRAKRFLEDNQGTYIAAAVREAGHTHPLLFSYDFDSEPRRLAHLRTRYAPLDYIGDTAGPAEIREALWGLWG